MRPSQFPLRRSFIRIAVGLAVGLPVLIAAPGDAAAAGDQRYCCWKIDVRAEGEFGTTFTARREASDGEAPGWGEPGDIEGSSSFAWVALSRGLYGYREYGFGPQRDPYFENLFAGRRSYDRAAKERVRFRESGSWCEMGPVESGTDPSGEGYQYQSCTPPANQPCESTGARPWKGGGGVQVVGRRGVRKLTLDVVGNFPLKCQLPFHGTSWLTEEHGLQGPLEYTFAPARTTGEKLRGRRDFPLTKTFTTTRETLLSDDQQHASDGNATVKVSFTYFPKRKLRKQRRELAALR